MSAPPFDLRLSQEAADILHDLAEPKYQVREKKVKKALRLLRDAGPSHPGLHSHKDQSITGPNGEDVWESYVENHTRALGGSGGGTARTRTRSPSSP